MVLFYLQKTLVFPMVFVPRQAGEPAKKRELLKVLEKVAMWQARGFAALSRGTSGGWRNW